MLCRGFEGNIRFLQYVQLCRIDSEGFKKFIKELKSLGVGKSAEHLQDRQLSQEVSVLHGKCCLTFMFLLYSSSQFFRPSISTLLPFFH